MGQRLPGKESATSFGEIWTSTRSPPLRGGSFKCSHRLNELKDPNTSISRSWASISIYILSTSGRCLEHNSILQVTARVCDGYLYLDPGTGYKSEKSNLQIWAEYIQSCLDWSCSAKTFEGTMWGLLLRRWAGKTPVWAEASKAQGPATGTGWASVR